MNRRNFLKISLPAILLAVMASGIATFFPLLVPKEPVDLTTSVSVSPGANFLGDTFTLTLDINYPEDRFSVQAGDIAVDFRPLTMVGEPTAERKPGRLTVQYKLRCLESMNCVPNNSYSVADIVINFVDNNTEKVLKKYVRPEPIYISPQIDPANSNASLRFPKEPAVKDNLAFFVRLMIAGFTLVLFAVWTIFWMFNRKNGANNIGIRGRDLVFSSDPFLSRLERLSALLHSNAEPRLVLAQSEGVVSDYLRSGPDISPVTEQRLSVIRRRLQHMAYQENDPSREEVAHNLAEITSVLSEGKE